MSTIFSIYSEEQLQSPPTIAVVFCMSEALSTRCAVKLLLLEPFFLPVSNLPRHLPQLPFNLVIHHSTSTYLSPLISLRRLLSCCLYPSILFCKAFVQQVLVCFTTKINAPRHCAPIPLTTDRIGFIPFLYGTSFTNKCASSSGK